MGGVASASRPRKLDDRRRAGARGAAARCSPPCSPRCGGSCRSQYQQATRTRSIVGTTPNYLEVRKYELAAGRMFTTAEDEGRARVAVSARRSRRTSASTTPEALIGEKVRIRGMQFDVDRRARSRRARRAVRQSRRPVLIPLNTARFRVIGNDRLRSISVLAPSEETIPATMAEIQRDPAPRAPPAARARADDFQIRNQADFLNTLGETTAVFTYLLAGIAAVSLLVGGIGIMNIMLVSVTERTREIGIRKALGATRWNILAQFLIEAVVLCCLGGIIGIGIGTGGAMHHEQGRRIPARTSR